MLCVYNSTNCPRSEMNILPDRTNCHFYRLTIQTHQETMHLFLDRNTTHLCSINATFDPSIPLTGLLP